MSFDILAPHYRWMEFVLAQDKLQRCRTAFLGRITRAARILILGEGNGRFLLECCRKFPNATITCVDSSARMLVVARRRLAGQGIDCARIDFIRADALTWNPPGNDYDLIVTHFFLDCFRRDQLEALIAKLTRVATPQANWLLADFQSASDGWRRQRSEIILWMMYRFFTVVTRLPAKELIDPASILEQNGYRLRARQVHDWDLLHSDWWQLERGTHGVSC